MLNRIFVVDSVTLTSTGTAVSSYTPWDQTTRKLPTQVVVKATGQGAYVRLSNDASAATNADVLVQAGDHVVLSVQGRRWVSVLSDGASSTVNVGALSTGVSGSAASLDLAFVDAGVLDPRVTFTRASTATYFNSAGVLTSAAIDESRRDFDPATLAVRGLLIEEARTNSIRNNTMQGAAAGTPGTLPTNWQRFTSGTAATSIVGTGTESGITYVDITFSGGNTDSISFFMDGTLGHAALNGQTWTGSAYYKLTAGSFANCTALQAVYEANAAGTALANSSTSITTVTGAALSSQRIATTRVNNNASTAEEQLTLQITGTGAFSFTLRIGLPQLEQGAFATSVIPTTTTALTRSADVASVNTLAPWFNSVAATIYGEWTPIAATMPSGAVQTAANFNDTTGNNQQSLFQIQVANAKASSNMFSGGVNPGRIDAGGAYSSATVKAAAAFAASDRALSANGGAAATSATGAIPLAITRLELGSSFSANYLNGYLRRITYYPRRLSNAELQAITA